MQDNDSALKLDALYTIFEKHLYDFEENSESESAFIDRIIQDYFRFLTTNKVVVPKRWQASIAEELRDQIHKMLLKKTYGCLSIEEFAKKQRNAKDKQKTTKKKYSKLY